MKLGFSTIGCPEWDWAEILGTAKDMGIDGIEIRGVEDELDPMKITIFDKEHLAKTRQQLAQAGIEIAMLASSVTLGSPKGSEEGERQLQQAKNQIDFAAENGIPFVRVLLTLDPKPVPADLEAAEERLAQWRDRVTLVHSNFDQLNGILDELALDGVDGMLFDLGVSSPQLDDGSRGFSYMADAPLDMRMDRDQGLSAADVVNGWSQEELRRILTQYGEERYAASIAAAIVRRRADKPIETTLELVDVIRSGMPARALKEKQHPAKRSFQAIRIAVNDELASVDRMVQSAVPRLNRGGRLAVITFHSLEDRIVKTGLAAFSRGCTCPPDFPVCVCGKTPDVRLVSRKPILPSEQEVAENPRARSAKLRVAEKCGFDL